MQQPEMPGNELTAAAHSQAPRERENRRAYATPELVEYGSVAKLTRTGGRTGVDFINMAMTGMGM
jgi:hypothetical protein